MNANQMLAVAACVAAVGAQARSTLPVGYQEVEYFSSLKATIKTGYTPEVTDRVETKILFWNMTGGRGIFCARGAAASDNTFSCYAEGLNGSSCYIRLDYGNYDGSRILSGLLQNKDTEIVYNTDNYEGVITGRGSDGKVLAGTIPLYGKSGSEVDSFSKGAVGSELLLFAMHNGDVNAPTEGTYDKWLRCYYFRAYDKYGNLKMNLVPYKNMMTAETAANKVYGFYDTVSQRSFEPVYGASDSSCSVSGEVYARDVEDPQELEYVDTPTNQWVNTGVRPQWSDRVEMRFRLLGHAPGRALYWCRDSSNRASFSAFANKTDPADATTLRIDCNTTTSTTKSNVLAVGRETLLEYDGKTGVVRLDGMAQAFDKAVPSSSYTPAGPLALFAAHSCGADLSSEHQKLFPAYTQPLRFYGFRLTGEDGVAKIDLVPCRDGADGVVGLYDRVSRKFLTPTLFKGMTNDLLMAAGPTVECSTNRLTMAVNAAGTSVDLAFDASASARKLVLAYGNTDAAGAFHAWENRSDAVEVAAGATALTVALPSGFGTEYRVLRAFLGAVVSSESVFADVPVVARLKKSGDVPISADLTFSGSTVARRLFLVWGPDDVGNVLTGWAGKVEIPGGIPAGTTSLAGVAFPAEAQEFLSERGGFRFVIGDVATEKSYVRDGLFLQYDGINNAGLGRHSKKFDQWSDLVSSNDISVAETEESAAGGKDLICGSYVKLCRRTRATKGDVIGARPDVLLTMESCMRPSAFEGSSNVATVDLRYFGYMGWCTGSGGAMSLCRPVSAARTQSYLRYYDIGGASLSERIKAGTLNTYSVTLGYGDGTAPDSPAYFDGVLCGPHPDGYGVVRDSSDWSRQLKLGFIKSVTDVATVRLYDRELTPDERRWNQAIDRERFRGGEPVQVSSTGFVRCRKGLVVLVY